MADEERFDRALRLEGNFSNIDLRLEIIHPTIPGWLLEVDNIAQKGKTVFIFEGKSKKEKSALKQLILRYQSLKTHKKHYLKTKLFNPYTYVRIFYYSFKRKVFAEFSSSGNPLLRCKFENVNELAAILRKL